MYFRGLLNGDGRTIVYFRRLSNGVDGPLCTLGGYQMWWIDHCVL